MSVDLIKKDFGLDGLIVGSKINFESGGKMNKKEQKKELWKCECGRKLPTKGYVWRFRYEGWLFSSRSESGYLCDICTSKRECGGEY
jgi:hypothetical protein